MIVKILLIILGLIAALALLIILWGMFDEITGLNTYYKVTRQKKPEDEE